MKPIDLPLHPIAVPDHVRDVRREDQEFEDEDDRLIKDNPVKRGGDVNIHNVDIVNTDYDDDISINKNDYVKKS